MKKTFYTFILICSLFVFFGCDSYTKDEYGCFVSFSEAKEVAIKKQLPIFAIFTDVSEQAGGSLFFLNNILSNKEFKKYSKNKFVMYRMDISKESFQRSVMDESFSEKEMEKSLFYSNAIEEGFNQMAILGVQYTPFFAFFSPEGYAIREIEYPDDNMNSSIFCSLLDYYLPEVEIVKYLVEKINSAKTDKEKFSAIESLYLTTPIQFRNSLIELEREAITLDPNNESGQVGKYIFSVADEDAAELFNYKNDVEGALKIYLDTLKNPYIGTQEKIQCYVMSAYVLEKAGLIDDPRIVQYLNLALELNPDQQLKDEILRSIEFFKNSITSEVK